MKRLIEFILPICFHEYEIENKQEVFPYNPFDEMPSFVTEMLEKNPNSVIHKYKNLIGTQYTLKCKKCGEMKTFYAKKRYSK
jgi:hypothetical protein